MHSIKIGPSFGPSNEHSEKSNEHDDHCDCSDTDKSLLRKRDRPQFMSEKLAGRNLSLLRAALCLVKKDTNQIGNLDASDKQSHLPGGPYKLEALRDV